MNNQTEALMQRAGESPANSEPKVDDYFETFGYFEEIMDSTNTQFVGTQTFKGLTTQQKFGADGRINRLYKKGDVILIDKGHKPPIEYKFKQDTTCSVTAQALCGRMRERA